MKKLLLAIVSLLLLAEASVARTDEIVVGRENWERPWLPYLQKPTRKVAVPIEKRIDVVILGDGYLAHERVKFEADVRKWYERFLQYYPWSRMRGVFRVRGIWTPSDGRATEETKSHYRIPVAAAKVGDVSAKETAESIFAALQSLDFNRAESNRYLTHTVVVMLVLDERGRNPSGKCRTATSPDGKMKVKVGYASYTHHEFGHAYGRLRDEYIQDADSRSSRKPPERVSVFGVKNVAYTTERRLLPWAHLTPGSPINPDRNSVIGVCWLGGIDEIGAWHSEGKCLMNGRHDNWDLGKTERGAQLRDKSRYCFWCEEILVARTYAKAGMLGNSDDGERLWKSWVEVRPHYHRAFDVAKRIRVQNAENVRSRLHEAKIYVRPSGDATRKAR